ncbi:histidine kinase N-terminal 7TM domain-containing protein [Candidatus Leptofilum sp.]|uniref:histidine kinase N-terminal 7TM domain-containing protein n=1 Tax=Candidatus Leptofilum sp. TaxID=3241576 RepID=UPI003B5C4D32
MNFAIITLAIGAVVLMTTAVITWPRRHSAHWILSFLGLATAVSIWLIGYAIELSVFGLDSKVLWAKIQYIGISFTSVAWFLFAYQFLNLNLKNLKSLTGLLSIVPVITIILAFTNEQHGLLWTQNLLDESGVMPMLSNNYGGWFWVHSTYSYLLIIGGIGLFLRVIRRYPHFYRWQSAILILAAATPLLGNLLYISGNSPIPQFDLTPFSFAVSALLIAWGVARLDLFDIVPIARRMVVEGMPDGIALIDLENRVLDINEAGKRLLGQENERIIGQKLGQLTSALAKKIVAYDGLEVDEEISIEQEGLWQHFNVRIRPLHITSPHPRARILILHNISRRKAAEARIRQRNRELQELFTEAQEAREAAEQANKAKGDLLAKVSHELRTPLGVILGHAEMLQEGVYGSVTENQKTSLSRIIENSGYLNEQIKGLLDLPHLESGKLKVELYEFDLADMLEQAHHRIQPIATAKNLDFNIDVAPNVPARINSNALRLQQILINLCTNAVKFTNKGQVTVAVTMADDAHWQMAVTDTGKGIPQKEFETIFQPFYQLQDSMTQGQSGVGLGLTIAKELTTALGGKICVESEQGAGSTFLVTLPVHTKLLSTGLTQ